MRKVFIVTGAFGHLGSTVVKKLYKKGEIVRCFVLPNDKSHALDDLNVQLVKGDICDADSLDNLFLGLDNYEVIVIHTAGIVTIATKFDKKVYDVNVAGTQNIINKCKQYNVKRLIYISSVHCIPKKPNKEIITETKYFNPDIVTGLYAKTKAQATKLVLESTSESLECIVIHPSGLIGPDDYGQGHLTQLVMDYLDGRLTACINGGYDFVDVRDVAEGIISSVYNGKSGECYILSNKFYNIIEIIRILSEISGKKMIKIILPSWFACFTAIFAEAWYKLIKQPPLYTKSSLYALSSNAFFSHERADKELNYSCRNMKDTLKDTVTFLIENNRLKKYKKLL